MGCSQCKLSAECGKTQLRDQLTGALIGLARATEGNEYLLSASTAAVTLEGLRATRNGVTVDDHALRAILEKVDGEKRKLVPECYNCASSCGRTDNYDIGRLWRAEEDVRSLKFLILFGIRRIACHMDAPDEMEGAIPDLLYRALFALGMEDWGVEELLPIVREVCQVNAKCGGTAGCLPPCISPEIVNRFNL